MSYGDLNAVLGPIYTEHQQRVCDVACDIAPTNFLQIS